MVGALNVDYIPWTNSQQEFILLGMKKDFMLICKTLGVTVRQHRKIMGISQEELAFRAELDRTYISQIERGVSNPSLQVLVTIAKKLNVELIDLFVDTDTKTPSNLYDSDISNT